MNLLTLKGRQSQQRIRWPFALTMLLGFAGQVSAQCPSIASPAVHASIAARMLEMSCSREASTHINAPVRTPIENHVDLTSNRWSMAAVSAANAVSERAGQNEADSPVARSLSGMHWADSHDWINNPPEWIKAARNYKRQGMPIIHLMQSKETVVALGVSNHGKPGLYFTRKVGF